MMPVDALRAVFRVNLGLRKTERVLVFTDRPTGREVVTPPESERRQRLRDVANLSADIGRALARKVIFVEYPATGMHGKEPPAVLWEAAFGKAAVERLREAGLLGPLLSKRASEKTLAAAERIIRKHRRSVVDAVVALSNYSTSHTTFRDFLTRVSGARFASMPLFDVRMLEGPMNIDWKELARTTRAVASIVGKAVSVDVESENGTAISFSTRGRKAHADTGVLTRPGAFGNLPAGEVFLAPVEGTAEGTLVLEWAPTRRLESPVTLTVREGRVVEVSGTEEFAGYLSAKLAERAENANIAELGIGTNRNATRPDNVLESEKILGTVHVALGDNSSFGGTVKTPFHQDFVFFRPVVDLIDKSGARSRLLEGGRLLI